MIRAGRVHLVRTLAEVAEAEGVPLGSFKNKRLHKRPAYPKSLTSVRTPLFDGEQVDAFLNGTPGPSLPAEDRPDDLLDRNEAPALLRLSPRSWESYRHAPGIAEHVVPVKGIDHWPRQKLLDWNANRPGSGHGGGRPTGTGDLMPREDLAPRIATLLDAEPGITAEQAADELGVHEDTAQRALTALRAQRVRELLDQDAAHNLGAEQVSERLGYPLRAARNAVVTAHAQRRAAAAAPYVESVVDALQEDGIPVLDVPGITVRPGGVAAAGIPLGEGAPAATIVWDERYGWRTDPRQPAPVGRELEAPTGPGIRYLAHGITPAPADVVTAVRDRRTGTKRPRTVVPLASEPS
ncbi:hypothetical protein [Streptomyces sp. NPDC059009]|uniref:hypothetical protein n=1 Tax=Streptomyces sp. NPDC059009 TaxID=3346694 RepID=UPI00369CF342